MEHINLSKWRINFVNCIRMDPGHSFQCETGTAHSSITDVFSKQCLQQFRCEMERPLKRSTPNENSSKTTKLIKNHSCNVCNSRYSTTAAWSTYSSTVVYQVRLDTCPIFFYRKWVGILSTCVSDCMDCVVFSFSGWIWIEKILKLIEYYMKTVK
jgi:hypothetical protein